MVKRARGACIIALCAFGMLFLWMALSVPVYNLLVVPHGDGEVVYDEAEYGLLTSKRTLHYLNPGENAAVIKGVNDEGVYDGIGYSDEYFIFEWMVGSRVAVRYFDGKGGEAQCSTINNLLKATMTNSGVGNRKSLLILSRDSRHFLCVYAWEMTKIIRQLAHW